jgi:hypothetical protein
MAETEGAPHELAPPVIDGVECSWRLDLEGSPQAFAQGSSMVSTGVGGFANETQDISDGNWASGGGCVAERSLQHVPGPEIDEKIIGRLR